MPAHILSCHYCTKPFAVAPYRIHTALFCSRRCAYDFRKEPAEVRFWRYTKKEADDACWEWQSEFYRGYGRLFIGGKERRAAAHRFSYALHYGLFFPALFVLHRCNNKRCVNPQHLFLGTAADNARDAARDGLYHSGEANTNAKLTSIKVRQIRALWPQYSQHQLAQMFGTTQTQIHNIVRFKTWKHVSASQ